MPVVNALLNLFNSPSLGALTEKRNFGSVTFLGRYGLADVMLSNFSNSGINRIGILVDRYTQSMRNHVQTGKTFVNNTKIGGLDIIYDEQGNLKPQLNNDISDLTANISYMEHLYCDYLVVAPSNMLMTFDFRKMLNEHIKSGRSITMMYQHRSDLKKRFLNSNVITLNEDGSVKTIKRNDGELNEGDVSLEIYIFSNQTFIDMVSEQPTVSLKYGIKEMVAHYIKKNKKEVGSYLYDGYLLPIFSLEDYVESSFTLLEYENSRKFFKKNWPIYTTTHDTPPALYGAIAEVKNSFIANGAVINGRVENSIISRDVIVKEDAVIKNSILFTNTVVEKGVKLDYVLTDKKVVVGGNKNNYKGTKKQMLVIKQGQK